MKTHKLYVAYGSNLNKEQMEIRCPESIVIGKCEILYYSLKFNYFATIKKDIKNNCPAGLWLVSDKDLKALDFYEGISNKLYKRIFVKVLYKGKIIKAITYQMNEDIKRKYSKSFNEYYKICSRGYKDFNLDRNYLVNKAKEFIDNKEG